MPPTCVVKPRRRHHPLAIVRHCPRLGAPAALSDRTPNAVTSYSIAISVPQASSTILPIAYTMMESHTSMEAEHQEGDEVDFVAVVDQVITLLRQRGRVAYRTLK